MPGEKFDARLHTYIDENIRRGLLRRLRRAQVNTQRIPVTLTHVDTLTIAANRNRQNAMTGLASAFDIAHAKPMQLLQSIGVQPIKLPFSNSLHAKLTIPQLHDIEKLDEIGYIRVVKTEQVAGLAQSVQVIGAPMTWTIQGMTGAGIKVGVVDSGIDKNHPGLAGTVVAEDSTVPTQGVNVPGSHGTHVAGIIASQDTVHRGVAHSAKLINIKATDAGGNADHVWVENGMQRAYELGADVVNISLGMSHVVHGWECPDGRCSLCRAAQTLVDLGVVVVAIAGNDNSNRKSISPVADTNLVCPGQCRGVITVGAVNNNLTMYAQSSIGPPSYWDGWQEDQLQPDGTIKPVSVPGEPWVTKPDLCAPGVGIKSASIFNAWVSKTGTSQACPHVAAVVALMLEKQPGLSPHTVKDILTHTAHPLPFDRFTCGAGLVNAYGAVLHS